MEAQMKINGEAVRALREQKSWSQEHLASASGLSVRTVQRVEIDGVASAETRLALAAALDVPVWVGGGAQILAGVRIGSRSVIGAGSVVTRDVPEGVLALGNPCRVVRKV